MGPKKTSGERISQPAFSLDAAAATLEALIQVDFGFAWQPAEGAFVLVLSLKADGSEVPGAAGGTSTSGYHVPLGKWPPGKALRIEWSVQTFNDLKGMGAFTWTATRPSWTPLGPAKAPMTFKEIWSSSQTFTVA
jgi:hypothetical protein